MKTRVILIALVIAIALDALAHRPLRNFHKGEITKVYINPSKCWDGERGEFWCNNVRLVPQTLDARERENGR
jgi:hypothetical protein